MTTSTVGHGHVVQRADGVKARCGGPALCGDCAHELAGVLRRSAGGPSKHLSWAELQCKDGTEYPDRWRIDRAVDLAVTFESIRADLGGEPIFILSGYRTPSYNAKLEGAAVKSQHLEGRALDIKHPRLKPAEVFSRIRASFAEGRLPLLGGIGLYRTFVHVDTRPRKDPTRLAVWAGKGVHL